MMVFVVTEHHDEESAVVMVTTDRAKAENMVKELDALQLYRGFITDCELE